MLNGFIYNMHSEFTALFPEIMKLKKLKLYREGGVLHFERARDLLVIYKLVDHAIEAVYVALMIRSLEAPSAVLYSQV